MEYKRNVGYKCENDNISEAITPDILPSELKVGFENELYIIINVFDYKGKTYCNSWDKRSKKVFLMLGFE